MPTLPTVTADVKKLSFAKVAASAKENVTGQVSSTRATVASPTKQATAVLAAAPVVVSTAMTKEPGVSAVIASVATAAVNPKAGAGLVAGNKVVDGLKDLRLDAKGPNLVVNGTGSTTTERSSKTGNSQSPSDDVSQRADSNSELGTKPPSLDGKSITSGTTFALDEKESLRPDDSASVKAAAEDDDSFSFRGSFLPSSRVGSEIAARFRIQLGDMPPRTITTHILSEPHVQGTVTPQSGASDKQPVSDSKLPLTGTASGQDAFNGNGFYRQNPDEKLLEAMQSPKDRLFLLRLEKDVIEFVQDSKEPFMDLPPCNSFCRMLTHKLADYYHMTHSFEAVAGAVRIYRTPFCRVPPSLASIAANASNSSTPPPAVLPRKIMRRGEVGEAATTSASPSKPTSEAGSDSKDKAVPAKEKLTREEREEAYNRARERIFGSNEKMETSTPENDESAGVSRASSVSAKDKSNLGKRGKTGRQRRDDSESFDSRSTYAPVYGPQQQTWFQPQYIPVTNPQFNGQFQQPYQNSMPPAFGPPNQAYPPMMPNNGFVQPFNNMPPYAPQPAQQRFQPPPGAPMAPYGAPVQNVPHQAWQPNFNHAAYQSRAPPPTSLGIPYAYGQLPANANPHDPKSQHPIPGSYNRHAFNPKTQSFVPSNGMAPMQAPSGPFNGVGPHHGSPQMNPQNMNYNSYPQTMTPPAPYGGNGAGYGMVRQGSNSSMPPYHTPQMPPQAPAPQQHGPPHGPLLLNPNPAHIPSKPSIQQGPSQSFSHLPNYGNPATLPQKPTT